MKRISFATAAKALAMVVTAAAVSSCSSMGGSPRTTGEPAIGRYAVQGRDLGRGGATSGGLSSVDPTGNSADYSLYEEAQIGGR
jgi:hypothetical protein